MNQALTALHTNLRSDLASLDTLIGLLMEERQAVIQRDLETLDRVNSSKNASLAKLDQTGIERDALLARMQLGADPDQLQRFLSLPETETSEPGIHQTWAALRQRLLEVRRENEINGKLISRNRQTLTHLVNLLRGQTGPTGVYGRSGQPEAAARPTEIARA